MKVILMLSSDQFEDPGECPQIEDDRHAWLPALREGEDPYQDPVWKELGNKVIDTHDTHLRYFFIFDESGSYQDQLIAIKCHMNGF